MCNEWVDLKTRFQGNSRDSCTTPMISVRKEFKQDLFACGSELYSEKIAVINGVSGLFVKFYKPEIVIPTSEIK